MIINLMIIKKVHRNWNPKLVVSHSDFMWKAEMLDFRFYWADIPILLLIWQQRKRYMSTYWRKWLRFQWSQYYKHRTRYQDDWYTERARDSYQFVPHIHQCLNKIEWIRGKTRIAISTYILYYYSLYSILNFNWSIYLQITACK